MVLIVVILHTDVDECQNKTICDATPDSTCSNLEGTFKCDCNKGLFKNTTTGKCDGNKQIQIML